MSSKSLLIPQVFALILLTPCMLHPQLYFPKNTKSSSVPTTSTVETKTQSTDQKMHEGSAALQATIKKDHSSLLDMEI